jgi:hypothetical protein
MKYTLGLICYLFVSSITCAEQLVVYPAPQGAIQNTEFSVKVRIPGQPWQELAEYMIKVDQIRGVDHVWTESSVSYFDFSGKVEVSVTSNRRTLQSARIRPLSYGIQPQIHGDTLTFTLSQPCNLSIEVNGDIFRNLHLFANPLEDDRPDPKDPNVIYFGPGTHELPGGHLRVPSGKTCYLAGGAILKADILIRGAKDVQVRGRGIIDQSYKGGVRITNSKNVTVDGIISAKCFTGGSDHVTIRNVKVISYDKWGDGLNVLSSSNVLFDGIFCRSSDDCTTVYGTRGEFVGGCSNITMQNSTLWADVAHPIFIGLHGNTPNPELLENLKYINIDILDHKEAQIDYQGCMTIHAGDSNLVRNVRFENIRVEDFRQGQLLNIGVVYNDKYCTSPGRGVENVVFKNITYTGKNSELSMIAGYNENRKVKNVVFENLVINGTVISDDMKKPGWYKTSDMARIFVNPHVEGLKFTSTD